MSSPDLAGSHVGIWGLGKEGQAAFEHLAGTARAITLVDERGVNLPDLPNNGVEIHDAGSNLDILLQCDVVIVSPGVPRTHAFLPALVAAPVRLTTGADLWMAQHGTRTIGVTGTKGKSTTASLLHQALVNSGVRAALSGNIGEPLLRSAADADVVVAELSSYQCAWLTTSPRVAVITNLFEEHLSWHGSIRRYWRDKSRIFTRGANALVCDRSTLSKLAKIGIEGSLPPSVHMVDDDSNVITTPGGRVDIDMENLPPALRSRHNRHNLHCALLAASLWPAGEPAGDRASSMIRDYPGLPHRLETVAIKHQVTWIDDTLSTAPESVIAAVESRSGVNGTVVIIGGQSRGISYQVLNDYLCAHAASLHAVAIPSNGLAATDQFGQRFPDRRHPASTIEEAVRIAATLAQPGWSVILSPGAPSFDHYRDYADKSHHYRTAIATTTNPR
jgi:UDP-N-acetylmuramoylalanine--D-glutamate ligase